MPGKPGSLGIYYLLDYAPEHIGQGLIRASGGFQAMIDACGESGGGLCAVPAGLYNMDATPTWRTWSNITIWVHSGAVFVGAGALPANAGSNVVRTEPSAALVGGAPVTQAFGDAAAAGTSATAAAVDHRHGMPGDRSVGTAQLALGAVGTPQLAAGAVTQRIMAQGVANSPTTTSAAFVDLPDMAVTLTTVGGDLAVWLSGCFEQSVAGGGVPLVITLDGGAGQGQVNASIPLAGNPYVLSTMALFTGVAAGAHTVKGRWLVGSGGTATAFGTQRQLLVEELRA